MNERNDWNYNGNKTNVYKLRGDFRNYYWNQI